MTALDHHESLGDGGETASASHRDGVGSGVLRKVKVNDDLTGTVGGVGLHDNVTPDEVIDVLRVELGLLDETTDTSDGETNSVNLHKLAK